MEYEDRTHKEKLKKAYNMNYWEKWKVQIVKDKGLGFRMKMDEV